MKTKVAPALSGLHTRLEPWEGPDGVKYAGGSIYSQFWEHEDNDTMEALGRYDTQVFEDTPASFGSALFCLLVFLCELRPIFIKKYHFAVSYLVQKKIANANFTASTNQEVWIAHVSSFIGQQVLRK